MSEDRDDILKTDSEETVESTQSIDPFDRLMFGNRHRRNQRSEEIETQTNDETNQVDFAQLMKQADDIMNSINKIKPVFKELSPLLDFFKKK